MISKLAVAFALVLSVSVQLGHGNGVACPALHAPVCGNDGNTYSNKCFFEHAAKSDANLKIIHYGRCEDGYPVCSDEYQPLCGSNGITYDNECLFQYATLTDSSLIIAKLGKCEETARNIVKTLVKLTCGCEGKLFLGDSFDTAKQNNPKLVKLSLSDCLDYALIDPIIRDPHIPNITLPGEPSPPKYKS